jgi:dipeptidyl aminopeptidase/acylaminoacyl peptidase
VPEQAIEFAAADGSPLRGTLCVPAGAGPFPAVLCVHGLTLDQGLFASPAAALAHAGVASLRLDLRGHGASGGQLKAQGFEDQLEDLRHGLRALAARPDVDAARVGLLGFSMGGAMGAVVSAEAGSPLNALALWSPLLKTGPWNQARQGQYGPPKDGYQEIWDGILVSEKLFSQALDHDPYGAALAFKGPFFVCHGGKDRNHPQARSVELAQARQAADRSVASYFPANSGHRYHDAAERATRDALSAAFFASSL